MKFSQYEPTENGFNINAKSKFLDLIFKHYGKKARKLLTKKGIVTETDKMSMTVSYNIRFKVEKEEENG